MPARKTHAKRAAALVVAALLIAPVTAHAASLGMTSTEKSFLRAVNATRAQHSLPLLRPDAELLRAARSHSADMVARQYFAHGDFAGRLWRFGARGPRVGENLGWSVDDGGATQRIVGKWLASPPHRAVLLRRGFRSVGIGVARGAFRGEPSCLVVTTDLEGT